MQLKSEMFILGLTGKQLQKISQNFVWIYDDTESFMCRTIQRFDTTHNGRMDSETDELMEMAKISTGCKKKLNFLCETEKKNYGFDH